VAHDDDIGGPDHNELVIALVAAVGTNVTMVVDELRIELSEYDYEVVSLRLSNYLAEEAGERFFTTRKFDDALWEAMSAGDELRDKWGRGDALVLHAISDIVATRNERSGVGSQQPPDHAELEHGTRTPEPPAALDRVAFVLRSLKTQDELQTLRAVYGPRLIVIAVYSPTDARIQHLGAEIEASRGTKDRTRWMHQPDELVERDEKDEKRARGQDVSGTFHRADFFVRGSDPEVARGDIQRTLEILFGSPFRTPTRDEHGQYLAAGAALRSAEFGRQVGAAIATKDGSIISVGANEVPTAGGGSHWEDAGKGNRDFEIGDIDTNRQQFQELAGRLAQRVDERTCALIKSAGDKDKDVVAALETLREELSDALPGDLLAGGLKDLTEFGRAVHAEMSALLDAARRGVAVQDATLYTTTFPCHNCARHIVGAGIDRVVFIEPYTKSRAEQLHEDAIAIARTDLDESKVAFEPFVGVAPRRYREMFDAAGREQLGHLARKDEAGRKQTFDKRTALPVFSDGGLAQFRPEAREYRAKELLALEHFDRHHGQTKRSVRSDQEASDDLT
jgi:deoxycytidylate deaminase